MKRLHLFLLCLALMGCSALSPEPTPTPIPTSTPEPVPISKPLPKLTPLGRSSGNELHEVDKNEEEEEEEEIVECCYIIEVSGVNYEGVPGVSRFLHFDVECGDNWPVSPSECIPGQTFVGEPQTIPWAEVTCCAESDDLDVLHCKSDDSVEQKVSWTRVELKHMGCEWNSPRFYSPPYVGGSDPGCPFNQFMCAGICCSPGHCCDCPGGGGKGCYDSCSGCD